MVGREDLPAGQTIRRLQRLESTRLLVCAHALAGAVRRFDDEGRPRVRLVSGGVAWLTDLLKVASWVCATSGGAGRLAG